MDYETIRLKADERGITTLTLARGDKHNVMSAQMIRELNHAATALGEDEATRVVILAGDGRSFCAGADLAWMREQFDADRNQRMAEARKLAAMLKALNELPKPLIGRIHGQAFGGGVGLISICDVAIAADTARFGLTETRLGIIPATISPYVLARMGEGNARRVFMSGRLFDATEAKDLGLIAKVVTPDQLDTAIEAETNPYLAAAPAAVAAAKSLTRRMGLAIDTALVDDTVTRLADAWETEEAREGIGAFFDKRKAGWVR